MGESAIKLQFSIVMLNYQRVPNVGWSCTAQMVKQLSLAWTSLPPAGSTSIGTQSSAASCSTLRTAPWNFMPWIERARGDPWRDMWCLRRQGSGQVLGKVWMVTWDAYNMNLGEGNGTFAKGAAILDRSERWERTCVRKVTLDDFGWTCWIPVACHSVPLFGS